MFAAHDLHHILSGYSLDNYGEIGVISISVGQFNHPGLGFTDLVSLMLSWLMGSTPAAELSTVEDQARTARAILRLIVDGLDTGAAAQRLFLVIWEERMGQDLEELRAELGLIPVREGVRSWYSNPLVAAALAA